MHSAIQSVNFHFQIIKIIRNIAMRNQKVITYSELANLVERNEDELRRIDAVSSLPIERSVINSEAVFSDLSVKEWLANGRPGLEWTGDSLSLGKAKLMGKLETILTIYKEIERMDGLRQLLEVSHTPDAKHLRNVISQIQAYNSLYFALAIAGGHLIDSTGSNRSLKHEFGSVEWAEEIAGSFVEGVGDATAIAALSDIALPDLQLMVSELTEE